METQLNKEQRARARRREYNRRYRARNPEKVREVNRRARRRERIKAQAFDRIWRNRALSFEPEKFSSIVVKTIKEADKQLNT